MTKELPSDPERLAAFYMLSGSSQALLSVSDYIQNLQIFELDRLWNVDTPEYSAAANILEFVRRIIVLKHNVLAGQAQDLLN